jgi:hypothetical protein
MITVCVCKDAIHCKGTPRFVDLNEGAGGKWFRETRGHTGKTLV